MAAYINSSAINMDNFDHEKFLGQGTYGLVSLVRKNNGLDAGMTYAMKALRKDTMMSTEENVGSVKNELKVLIHLNGAYSVRLLYTFQTDRQLYMVMELVEGCTLWNYIYLCKRLTLKATRFFIVQIMLAIDFLHDEEIVYRDLKPENIMVGTDGYLKLIDFGHAKTGIKNWCSRMYTMVGTPEYMAPEQIDQTDGYTRMVDWWAIGIVAYQMFYGILPFDTGDRSPELFRMIKEDEPAYPIRMNKDLRDFIEVLLRKDPNQRGGSTGIRNLMSYGLMDGISLEAMKAKMIVPPLKKRVPHSSTADEKDVRPWEFDDAAVTGHFAGFDYTAPEFRSRKRPWCDGKENEDPKRRRNR